MLTYKYAVQTNIGGRRENQDSYGSAMTPYGLALIVCDGMGGAAGGKQAAEMAVAVILRELKKTIQPVPRQAVILAIEEANKAIYQISTQYAYRQGMGTTTTVVLLGPTSVVIAHVGDSRVYHLRNGAILSRTFDHSAVFERVRQGQLNEEQARLSPDSNIILRALGVDVNVEIDVHEATYLSKDRFVLCTDGVSGALPEPELLALFNRKNRPIILVDEIIDHINHLGYAQGGRHDNLTVALLDIG